MHYTPLNLILCFFMLKNHTSACARITLLGRQPLDLDLDLPLELDRDLPLDLVLDDVTGDVYSAHILLSYVIVSPQIFNITKH